VPADRAVLLGPAAVDSFATTPAAGVSAGLPAPSLPPAAPTPAVLTPDLVAPAAATPSISTSHPDPDREPAATASRPSTERDEPHDAETPAADATPGRGRGADRSDDLGCPHASE
jgi:hypothetical protein